MLACLQYIFKAQTIHPSLLPLLPCYQSSIPANSHLFPGAPSSSTAATQSVREPSQQQPLSPPPLSLLPPPSSPPPPPFFLVFIHLLHLSLSPSLIPTLQPCLSGQPSSLSAIRFFLPGISFLQLVQAVGGGSRLTTPPDFPPNSGEKSCRHGPDFPGYFNSGRHQ